MGNFLPVFWRNMSAVGSSLRLVPSRGHLNCLKSTGSGRMLEGFFQWHNKLAWQVWNGVEKLLTLGFVMASGQNQVLFENQAKLGRRHHQHCSAIFFNPWNPWDFVLAPSGSAVRIPHWTKLFTEFDLRKISRLLSLQHLCFRWLSPEQNLSFYIKH